MTADSAVRARLRDLYSTEPAAKTLLDSLAVRERDAASTSIDRLADLAGISRRRAVDLARTLDQIGAGTFVLGRRGQRSRIEWQFDVRSLGLAAAQEDEGLRKPTDAADEGAVASRHDTVLAAAKLLIARSLGVPIEAIEIVIRA